MIERIYARSAAKDANYITNLSVENNNRMTNSDNNKDVQDALLINLVFST
ncbi:MAG TPA: hypothetical protein VFI70_13565 [Nitrososphaeraceae archaeon]|nr:hypothetical protein [Nitrososphaeraceae archaeon]